LSKRNGADGGENAIKVHRKSKICEIEPRGDKGDGKRSRAGKRRTEVVNGKRRGERKVNDGHEKMGTGRGGKLIKLRGIFGRTGKGHAKEGGRFNRKKNQSHVGNGGKRG